MVLPTGTITMAQVNGELGLPSTTIITLNDAEVRALAERPASGVISMDDLRGKSRISDVLNASGTFVSGNYTYKYFDPGSGPTFQTIGPSIPQVDVLLVGGGGGGGYATPGFGGGGGGAGNVRLATFSNWGGYTTKSVSIGQGGSAPTGPSPGVGSPGGTTTFDNITASGGGGGGRFSGNGEPGGNGGSGGGAGNYPPTTSGGGARGTLEPGSKNNGGNGAGESYFSFSGGGGGAGAAGRQGTPSPYPGGNGIDIPWLPGAFSPWAGGEVIPGFNNLFYGGGGGAGGGDPYSPYYCPGGRGGGGKGRTSPALGLPFTVDIVQSTGKAKTGGGGGGGSHDSPGRPGGSGIVIIRYTTPS